MNVAPLMVSLFTLVAVPVKVCALPAVVEFISHTPVERVSLSCSDHFRPVTLSTRDGVGDLHCAEIRITVRSQVSAEGRAVQYAIDIQGKSSRRAIVNSAVQLVECVIHPH